MTIECSYSREFLENLYSFTFWNVLDHNLKYIKFKFNMIWFVMVHIWNVDKFDKYNF